MFDLGAVPKLGQKYAKNDHANGRFDVQRHFPPGESSVEEFFGTWSQGSNRIVTTLHFQT